MEEVVLVEKRRRYVKENREGEEGEMRENGWMCGRGREIERCVEMRENGWIVKGGKEGERNGGRMREKREGVCESEDIQ